MNKDMSEYENLYINIVSAVRNRFMNEDMPIFDTQTACAIALRFGLCEDNSKTAKRLVELTIANDKSLSTGFIGTPLLLHVLSDNGYTRLANDILLREDYPSWLYRVNKGATTIREHLDYIKEDSSLLDTKMNSFNHYAYGSVYDWIFGVSAGIKVLEDDAGYKHILIKPTTYRRLGYLKAGIETKNFRLESHWYYKEDKIYYEFTITFGTTAEIEISKNKYVITDSGKYIFSE